MAHRKEDVLQILENLVNRVMLHSQDARDVECRIFPPQATGHPYMIELAHERYVRRVPVDQISVMRLVRGHNDPALVRDLRTALLAVIRLSRKRER
jgi:hypothetical protein